MRMKLYLSENERLLSSFIPKALSILLKGMSNSPILEDIDSIDSVRATIDPVQVFIDYWVGWIDSTITPERQQYIRNSLYAVKGAPAVFEEIERCFEIPVEWEYDFPRITVCNFSNSDESLELSNVTIFEIKLRYLLYHLLYFTELNLYIKNLVYRLRGTLSNNYAIIKKGYVTVKTNWDENDIF